MNIEYRVMFARRKGGGNLSQRRVSAHDAAHAALIAYRAAGLPGVVRGLNIKIVHGDGKDFEFLIEGTPVYVTRLSDATPIALERHGVRKEKR